MVLMRKLAVVAFSVMFLSMANIGLANDDFGTDLQEVLILAGEELPSSTAQQVATSHSQGLRTCSATSGDGKNSCSVSCKANERAICGNTQTTVECRCM